jgi:hypothetical protein
MATVTYEDMTMAQLKALCKDRGLGTGRSKQDLIEKLEAFDAQEPDDTDLTEDQIDKMLEEGSPVELEPAPEVTPEPEPEPVPKDEDPRPTIFRITVPHSGPLLDSQHEAYRKRTYGLAQAEGLIPFGGEMAPRLVKAEPGQLTYEIEVHG